MYLSSLKKRCFLLITVSPTDTKKAAEKQAVLCTHFMAQKHALYLRLFIR